MSLALATTDFISTKIYFLRGEKVLLETDLAMLYGVEVKRLKAAVRRNIDRFPEDFMFELSIDEWSALRSQFVTLEQGRGKYSKYPPFAFTEQGVAMLSGILKANALLKPTSPLCALLLRCESGCNPTKSWPRRSGNWKAGMMIHRISRDKFLLDMNGGLQLFGNAHFRKSCSSPNCLSNFNKGIIPAKFAVRIGGNLLFQSKIR